MAEKRLLCAWNVQHDGRMFGYEPMRFEPQGSPPRDARLQRWPECTASFPSRTSTVADILGCMDVAQSGNPWLRTPCEMALETRSMKRSVKTDPSRSAAVLVFRGGVLSHLLRRVRWRGHGRQAREQQD
ncbi:hypothetical protein WMF45_05735 [Sorangium sp. So ce448]|uniref:hypothetical protein n=1 Tax=Sorangium sp. So ce448 TaxID=3133314 RepID=UPI003F5DF818